jgi:hypothetical protein
VTINGSGLLDRAIARIGPKPGLARSCTAPGIAGERNDDRVLAANTKGRAT